MYVKQEAVFSPRIEGAQSTLEDVLEFEAGPATVNGMSIGVALNPKILYFS
jgi:hypothetical protein